MSVGYLSLLAVYFKLFKKSLFYVLHIVCQMLCYNCLMFRHMLTKLIISDYNKSAKTEPNEFEQAI